MLRKEEKSSWVVEGWVASESSLESHLMPKRQQSHATGIVVDCAVHNQQCLCRKELSKNGHSGLQALTATEVTIRGGHQQHQHNSECS